MKVNVVKGEGDVVLEIRLRLIRSDQGVLAMPTSTKMTPVVPTT